MTAPKLARVARPALAVLALGASGFAFFACSLAFDASSLSEGSSDASSLPDGPPGTTPDAGTDATTDAATGPCPGTAGPVAVRVSNDAGVSFCIDSTEVTVSQYQVFVDAKKGDMSGQITPDCDFNTTYEPRTEDGGAPPRSAQGDIPVGLVDWCDAYAYCKWANKRLCGRIGGGPAPFALPGDATESQWMFACSAGGAHPYAYGATFDTNACNDGETYSDIAPVKKFPKCTGGFPGLFDMSGNVEEWEDSCDGQGHCNTRGGSAWDERYTKDHKEVFSCGVTFGDDWIDERYEDVGFRCCSP